MNCARRTQKERRVIAVGDVSKRKGEGERRRRTGKAKGDAAEDGRPHEVKEIGWQCVVDDWIAADVFENVEAMALDNIICNEGE